jgi:2-desacetyl-2-hydroxyethyl bacteriochlorophyllide A dehydrogenase
MRQGRLEVDEVDDPEPGPGQVLVRTLACGICGSDLHALAHADEMVAMSSASEPPPGMPGPVLMDPSRDVVMGHEFCAEVVAVGENAGHHVGDVVVSMPAVLDPAGLHPVGYSNTYPGGYGELMVLSDFLCMGVPNGLDPQVAALTEPLAVGVHAGARSRVTAGHAAVVLGCGPVGLAVIAALHRAGAGPIVAADLSPTRRRLAEQMGAHEVVDPREQPPVAAWRRIDGSKPLVIFEAVGIPGMIEDAIVAAPAGSQILVVGVCMQADTFRPMVAVAKELSLQFVLAYDPLEFADSLRLLAEGEVDLAAIVTGTVGIEGVPDAFRSLADPDAHAKVLVVPGA